MNNFQRPYHQHHQNQYPQPITSPNDRDVINGRGQGIQRHPGNVIYRKLVFINKSIYAKCSKVDKIKISKGIVDAVRELGGRFLEFHQPKGIYHDIGDKRAKEKTSQALREGQTSIRKRLYQNGEMPTPSQQKEISADCYFGYSVQVLDSLWRGNENAPAWGWRNETPSLPTLPAAAATVQPHPHTSPVPAAAPSTSTIDSVNFCASDINSRVLAMALDQFPGLAQSAKIDTWPVAMQDRAGRPAMQKSDGQFSFKATDNEQSTMHAGQTEMPSLPPAVTWETPDDSRPSMRLTNMRLSSTSSVAHILQSMRTSNEAKATGNVRGTIESVKGEIDELIRQSEQMMTQVHSMAVKEMNEAIKPKGGQVMRKTEEEDSRHAFQEVVLYGDANMTERMSDLRFSEEGDIAKPGPSLQFTDNLRCTESSRLTNYSRTSLMGGSMMTFGMDDFADRSSHDSPNTAAV